MSLVSQLAWLQQQLPEFGVEWHEEVVSTMPLASALARAGGAHLRVIGAEAQTAGVGRYRRPWHSARGSGLYFTVLLRPKVELTALPAVTLAMGLAVAEALRDFGFPADLRWPNDVLVEGKKVAGILTQLEGDCVISGIGLNVNTPDFPEELSGIATSLLQVGGAEVDRAALLVRLLRAIAAWNLRLEQGGKEAIFAEFAKVSSYVYGKRVTVDLGNGGGAGSSPVTGTTAGLTPAGYLLVRDSGGQLHEVVAGGIRPAGEASATSSRNLGAGRRSARGEAGHE